MDAITRITENSENVSERQRLKLQHIENDYINAKEELEEENQKLANLIEKDYELIEDYSKFRNAPSIMITLAEITSLFMGEEYIYKNNDNYPSLMPRMLDNSDQIIMFYDEYNPSDGTLQFYKYDGDVEGELFQYTLFESENLETYNFLKRFIDYVISYKFEVSKKNLSCEELRKLEKEFILSNIEEIKKINEDAMKFDKAKYIESVAVRQKLLRRFVKDEQVKK